MEPHPQNNCLAFVAGNLCEQQPKSIIKRQRAHIAKSYHLHLHVVRKMNANSQNQAQVSVCNMSNGIRATISVIEALVWRKYHTSFSFILINSLKSYRDGWWLLSLQYNKNII